MEATWLHDDIQKSHKAYIENDNPSTQTDGINFREQQTELPLVEALEKYSKNPAVQFHIPGHTRGEGIHPRFKNLIENQAACLDTTDEFDNIGTLHPQSGPIAKAQELAAKAVGAEKSFFLLNGSSIGNFALAMTQIKPSQKVIIERNCHRSILTGLIMTGADPIWVTPDKLEDWSIWGAASPEKIEQQLKENKDVALVWITSPTYEGIVSDVKAIADICKKYNVPLFVDEAHGALWSFNDNMPVSALKLGADAVVHSMHKTGGSFSQSSILHIAKNSCLDVKKVENNLKLLHTTSPSILLLASLDAARAYLQSEEGHNKIENAVNNAEFIRKELSSIDKIKILDSNDSFIIDKTKMYIMIDELSGKRIENILEVDFNIEVEASTDNGILALSNIGSSLEDAKYFVECMKKIAGQDYADISYLEDTRFMPLLVPQMVMTPREAFFMETEEVTPKEAIGRISQEIIAECPPGIFVLAPGELVTENHLPYLTNYKKITVIKE